MSNLLVFVEVRRGEATGPSLYAISEARRVARELGATVYAVLPIGPAGEEALDAHARRLGEAGADRILCCADAALDAAPLDSAVGPLLAALCDRLRPVLTLFPAGAVGPALGPPLAVRTGGVFHPRSCLEVARAPEGMRLTVRRFRADGAVRALEVGGTRSRPAVVTLPAGTELPAGGGVAVEVEMIAYVPPLAGAPAIRELAAEDDDGAAIELAPVLLAVGAEVKLAEVEALRAAAPAGAVVVRDGEPTPGLDLACPARLLVAGKSPTPALLRRTLAPDTRVAVAGGKSAEKDLGRVDVVWRPAKDGLAPLLAALKTRPDHEGSS
jgi:electron transfer flavoprotein alpha subunit